MNENEARWNQIFRKSSIQSKKVDCDMKELPIWLEMVLNLTNDEQRVMKLK